MKKQFTFMLALALIFIIKAAYGFLPQSLVRAEAEIVDTKGNSVGKAHFTQGTEGVVIRIEITDLDPGAHAMHFHNIGDCKNGDFKSAGPHIMPDGKPHGYFNPRGPHAGNLPNLIVGDDRTTEVEIYTSLVSLDGKFAVPLLDDDGSTIIIHQYEDDHYTQPTGGSGERVACGVVKKVF